MKRNHYILVLTIALLLSLATLQVSANNLTGSSGITNYLCGIFPGLCLMPDDPIWY